MPVRRCLACRRVAAKPSLVRFVVAGGCITVDAVARQPGRGAYLCGQPGCTDTALRRDGAALRRALRANGRVEVKPEVLRAACEAATDERLHEPARQHDQEHRQEHRPEGARDGGRPARSEQ